MADKKVKVARQFNNVSLVMKEIRKSRKVSQTELSLSVDFKNGQFISNVERGLCSFPAKKLGMFTPDEAKRLIDAMIADYAINLGLIYEKTRKI